jgi:hypothetical protein
VEQPAAGGGPKPGQGSELRGVFAFPLAGKSSEEPINALMGMVWYCTAFDTSFSLSHRLRGQEGRGVQLFHVSCWTVRQPM